MISIITLFRAWISRLFELCMSLNRDAYVVLCFQIDRIHWEINRKFFACHVSGY